MYDLVIDRAKLTSLLYDLFIDRASPVQADEDDDEEVPKKRKVEIDAEDDEEEEEEKNSEVDEDSQSQFTTSTAPMLSSPQYTKYTRSLIKLLVGETIVNNWLKQGKELCVLSFL